MSTMQVIFNENEGTPRACGVHSLDCNQLCISKSAQPPKTMEMGTKDKSATQQATGSGNQNPQQAVPAFDGPYH